MGLHAVGVIHRDLKPENLLFATTCVDDHDIKISDFGLALVQGWDGMSIYIQG
jgi:serine/threonine protein kinase